MTYRRRLDPPTPVVIKPSPSTSGSRLSHEHDMNDAMWARLGWYEQYHQNIKGREDHGVGKAFEKYNHERRIRGRSFLVWFAIFNIAAPIWTYMIYSIVKKMGGW